MAKKDDALWKAVFEDVFADFLCFFFPDADELFNMKKGFVYMDKEFDQLFPPEEHAAGVRYVDKLVKVYLKSGGSRWILVHIEIQGQKGKEDLGKRMFRYFYRISDKHGVPVTAFAILTDGMKNFRPSVYHEEYLGTKLSYEYNVYKLLDQDEGELRASPNPFAVVILTALKAIKNHKTDDESLKAIKHDLTRELLKRKVGKAKHNGIMNFLKHYVDFENPEMMLKFEKEVEQLNGRSATMGTEQYLLQKAEQKGKHEEAVTIARELKKEGLSNEFIAKATKLSVEEVEKL